MRPSTSGDSSTLTPSPIQFASHATIAIAHSVITQLHLFTVSCLSGLRNAVKQHEHVCQCVQPSPVATCCFYSTIGNADSFNLSCFQTTEALFRRHDSSFNQRYSSSRWQGSCRGPVCRGANKSYIYDVSENFVSTPTQACVSQHYCFAEAGTAHLY